MNKQQVYISGHQVPDTDSICSALAYAELKNRTSDYEAIPIRLGELSRETKFVLNYFDVEPPILKDSMQPVLGEIDYDVAYGIAPTTTLKRATQIIQENHQNSLAVVDANRHLLGVISLSNITNSYATVWNENILGRSETPLENIVEVLSGEMVYVPEDPRPRTGDIHIHAMDHVNEIIKENDIVVVGDRPKAQEETIRIGASVVVLTNNATLAEGMEELCKEYRVTVLRTPNSTYATARFLPQAVPVSYFMASENIVAFHTHDALDEVRDTMAKTRFRSYPVLNSRDEVVGAISRYHVINTPRKKVILVDHNESTQSIPDLNQAEILEIIDHHRVANVATTSPIYFRVMPVGCTCTILSQMFFEQGVRPSRTAAGLMASAIISDTLLLRSPTTTPQDRLALQRLAPIAGIDPQTYAMEMFRAGTDLSDSTPEEILTTDVKPFDIDGVKAHVAQVFTMNADASRNMGPQLLHEMAALRKDQELDTYVLAMTDIYHEDSLIYVDGAYADAIASEFNEKLENGAFVGKGVLSRKKQLVPKITAAITRAKDGHR
ncbi:MAG: putative manganese-dependent inorganic diphosphatase [Peptoniphilaceae bacterium]|nr:putative manganese-dependent inorganic diphosphatase [Peptoniphilaceae bacterium]MDY6086237.1 putative manganese-dependent inorganic diphosphatase [Peptoniphilaceae bacterium]